VTARDEAFDRRAVNVLGAVVMAVCLVALTLAVFRGDDTDACGALRALAVPTEVDGG